MSNWQKIAFLEHELLVNLKMNTPGWNTKFKEWFQKAINLLENYKHYLINQESDEQERQEVIWN